MEKMLDGICSCKQGLERLDSFVGFLADPGRPLTPNKAKPSLGMEVVITRQLEAIQSRQNPSNIAEETHSPI